MGGEGASVNPSRQGNCTLGGKLVNHGELRSPFQSLDFLGGRDDVGPEKDSFWAEEPFQANFRGLSEQFVTFYEECLSKSDQEKVVENVTVLEAAS
jgi:hypothetical protein